MGTIFLLAGLVVGVLGSYSSAANAAGNPSPTKDLGVPSDDPKVFKVHSWNVLNIDKIDNGNGRYSVRTDFNMAIADNAWSSEDIAILSLQEICKSSVEQFAVENNIPAANYKFLDYKGSSYSGSNSVAYDKDIAGCRAGSNDSSDDYGLAIISLSLIHISEPTRPY